MINNINTIIINKCLKEIEGSAIMPCHYHNMMHLNKNLRHPWKSIEHICNYIDDGSTFILHPRTISY